MAPANSSPSLTNGDATPPRPHAVEPSHLPPADSPDLLLVPTTAVEYEQCTRLNADEWRGPLTIGQYLNREKHLMSQDMTRDGRQTGWILTSSKLPTDENGNRPILSSCESLLVKGYIARGGKLDEILVHGVGSVFCRPEHRGRGYAGRMMRELGKHLETWQQNNGDRGHYSVLYSDIGQKFYSQLGWNVYPSTHIHLPPMDAQSYNTARSSLPVLEDLSVEDLKSIPATKYVERELESLSKQNASTSFVAIKPDLEHFAWHHAREEFVSAALGRKVPEVKGAIDRATGVAIIWSRVFASEWQLHVLHTVIPPEMKNTIQCERSLSALLLRAQLEADKWDMAGGVEIWDPSDAIISAAQSLRTEKQDKVEIITRDQEHLCSLRWIGSGSNVDNVVWEYRQKYAWC